MILGAVDEKAGFILTELPEILAQQWVAVSDLYAMAFIRPPERSPSREAGHAAEQDRPDGLRLRRTWFEGKLDLSPERLVFIDETGASTKDGAPARRAPCGQHLRASVPHEHRKTTTFAGALRLAGITAPVVLDGPMNGAWFVSCIKQVVTATLTSGEVAMLNDLPAHKGAAVRRVIKAVGAQLLFLPPYSSDANPIENGLLQTHRTPAQGRRLLHQRILSRHRPKPRHLHADRVRQLLDRRRLRCVVIVICYRS